MLHGALVRNGCSGVPGMTGYKKSPDEVITGAAAI